MAAETGIKAPLAHKAVRICGGSDSYCRKEAHSLLSEG